MARKPIVPLKPKTDFENMSDAKRKLNKVENRRGFVDDLPNLEFFRLDPWGHDDIDNSKEN